MILIKSSILFFTLFHLSFANEIKISQLKELILKNNYKIKLAYFDLDRSKIEERSSHFNQDIDFAIAYFKENAKTPYSVSYDKDEVITQTIGKSIGLTKIFTYGPSLNLSMQSLDYESDSRVSVSDSWNQTVLQASLNIPLLKGFSKEFNASESLKSKIKIKRFNLNVSKVFEEEYESAIENYLQGVFITQKIEISKKSLKYYEKLYKYYENAFKNGVENKIKYLEFSSLFETQKTLLLKLENELLETQVNLIKIIYDDTANHLIQFSFQNIKQIKKFFKNNFNQKVNYIDTKLSELDLKIEENNIETLKIKNESLPTLDFKIEKNSYAIDNSFDESFNTARKDSFPGMKYSLEFSFNFGENYNSSKVQSQNIKSNNMYFEKKKLSRSIQENRSNEEFELEKNKKLLTKFNLRKNNFEKIINLKEKMYKNGLISILDFEKQIKDYNEFLTDHLDSKINKLQSQNKLNKINGLYYIQI